MHGEIVPVVHGGGDRGLRGGVLLPVRGGEPPDAGVREAAVGGGAAVPRPPPRAEAPPGRGAAEARRGGGGGDRGGYRRGFVK